MTTPATQTSGQVLAGTYRLGRKLGEGAFGEVWLAEHLGKRTDLVVKLLHPQWARVPAMVERFRREAEASRRIDHPSACKVFDFAMTEDAIPFITMEYLAGGTLKDELVTTGRMGLTRVAAWMVPVCEAVAVAHAAGIVHRDLKPENIMMKRQAGAELPVVLDFGIAKLLDSDQKLTQTGSILGSPAYMSPEQARGQIDIGPAADVYSLAIIVFELATGAPPFVSRSFAEIAVMHAHDPPPPLQGVPEVLAQTVERCLAKEPAARPPVADLARALRAAAQAQPSATPPPPRPARPKGAVDTHSARTVISTGKELEQAARPRSPTGKVRAALSPPIVAGAILALAILGGLVGWIVQNLSSR